MMTPFRADVTAEARVIAQVALKLAADLHLPSDGSTAAAAAGMCAYAAGTLARLAEEMGASPQALGDALARLQASGRGHGDRVVTAVHARRNGAPPDRLVDPGEPS